MVVDACRAHGGFYLGSIGGSAARLAQDCITKVEVLIEVKGQGSYELNGTVSRTGDDKFWIDLPASETAKLAECLCTQEHARANYPRDVSG